LTPQFFNLFFQASLAIPFYFFPKLQFDSSPHHLIKFSITDYVKNGNQFGLIGTFLDSF
jgi:hypothetical protein